MQSMLTLSCLIHSTVAVDDHSLWVSCELAGRVVFQHDWTSGHATRLNSRTGTEGLPVSCLTCDRSLHSGIRMPGS